MLYLIANALILSISLAITLFEIALRLFWYVLMAVFCIAVLIFAFLALEPTLDQHGLNISYFIIGALILWIVYLLIRKTYMFLAALVLLYFIGEDAEGAEAFDYEDNFEGFKEEFSGYEQNCEPEFEESENKAEPAGPELCRLTPEEYESAKEKGKSSYPYNPPKRLRQSTKLLEDLDSNW